MVNSSLLFCEKKLVVFLTNSRASELLFTIMFADDTSVFIEGQSYGNVCQLLNEELGKCDNWIKANKLTLNLKKNTFHDFPKVKNKM